MKKIYTFSLNEAPQAPMFQRILAVEGIATTIRNDRLSSALGEIPFTECFPELWVLDDTQLEKAQQILQHYLSTGDTLHPAWVCPNCGETVDGVFTSCWNCDHSSPSPEH